MVNEAAKQVTVAGAVTDLHRVPYYPFLQGTDGFFIITNHKIATNRYNVHNMNKILTKIIRKTLTSILVATMLCGLTSCVSFGDSSETYRVYEGSFGYSHDDEYANEQRETSATSRTPSSPVSYLSEPLDGPYSVVRVIDGDTIVVNIDGENVRVRFIGIDTPESVSPNEEENTPEGTAATNRTTQILQDGGNLVYLEYDEELYDSYGRLLAYVYIYDSHGFYLSPDSYVMVEEILLHEGLGEFIVINPNNRYEEFLRSVAPVSEEAPNEEQ